jgi:hypothetical protein
LHFYFLMSLYLAAAFGQVYKTCNTNHANIGGAKMDNTNTVPLTAVGLTVGEHAAPPTPTRRQSRTTIASAVTTIASAVKAAKRGGADRVEIDPRSGRIVIPLTSAASEASPANGGNDELEDWIAQHADKIKGPK